MKTEVFLSVLLTLQMFVVLATCRETVSKKENVKPEAQDSQTDKAFVNSKIAAFENKGKKFLYSPYPVTLLDFVKCTSVFWI